MKKFLFSMICTLSGILVLNAHDSHKNQETGNPVNLGNPKQTALDSILKLYTAQGIPGASVAVYGGDGWMTSTAGYAKTEDKTPMRADHIHYLQSISKSYMAVAIMKLKEQGKILLDAPITRYLPAIWSRQIRDAEKITVRMLLNHTSGIPEYSEDPALVSFILQHPLQPFSTAFAISTIAGQPLLFTPGSKHAYANTNYELLALITDAITGDHAAYISKNILEPLGLKNTFYRNTRNYLNNRNLVNSYWDVLNTGRPANITELQKANVSSFIGDDGIVCTPTDAVRFLRGLVEGRLLSASSLAEMQHWVNDDSGKPIYGLGLVHYEAGGIEGFGHSGGGIGGGCLLIYIPVKNLYVFMSVNLGTLFGGDLAKKADEMKNAILGILLS